LNKLFIQKLKKGGKSITLKSGIGSYGRHLRNMKVKGLYEELKKINHKRG